MESAVRMIVVGSLRRGPSRHLLSAKDVSIINSLTLFPRIQFFIYHFVYYFLSLLNLVGCFPGSSTVMLKNGERREMKDLQVGDSVRSIDSDGKTTFSPVILFIDINENHVGEFYVIHTESGHSISLTEEHLIYKKTQNDDEQINSANVKSNRSEMIMNNDDFTKMAYFKSFPPVFAYDVKEGDFVLVLDKKEGLKSIKVKRVQKTVNEGQYAPLTLEGNILVDDVLASCYTTVSYEWVGHAVFSPIRFLYKITQYLPFSQIKLDDANLRKRNNQNLHWYAKGLNNFAEMFLPSSLKKKLNLHSSMSNLK